MNQHRLRAIVVSAGLLFLAACTGTSEERVPTLLVVGYGVDEAGNGQNQVALIEDTYAGDGAAQDRLNFVTGSPRDLPAPPVALDVTDRNNTRNTLFVLSRADAPAEPSEAFLSLFNLENVNPDAPQDFAQVGVTLPLNAESLTLDPDLPPNLSFCPVGVQVSRTGRYISLLHDGEPCGIIGLEAVDILDLGTNLDAPVPRLMARFAVQVVPTGFYLDQERTDEGDRLYYLRDDAAGVQVTEVTLPSETDNNPDIDTAPGGDVRQVADLSADNQDAVDLGLTRNLTDDGSELLLVTLFDESFVPIRNYRGPSPAALTRIDTVSESRQIITDDFLNTDIVFVLGEDDFTVHENVSGEQVEPEDITATDAVYEPNNGFVFFTLGSRIGIFDPTRLQFDEDDTIVVSRLDVQDPPDDVTWSVMTWIRAVGSAAPVEAP